MEEIKLLENEPIFNGDGDIIIGYKRPGEREIAAKVNEIIKALNELSRVIT